MKIGRVEVESEVSLRERLMRLRGLVSSRLGEGVVSLGGVSNGFGVAVL